MGHLCFSTMLCKFLPWCGSPPNSFPFKHHNAILHRPSNFTDSSSMVSLPQISDWHHHGDTTELRASSSVVASSTKTIYPPTFLTSTLSMNRLSFLSNLVLQCLSTVLIQHFSFCIGCGGFLYRALILFLSPPPPNCSAWTAFHLSFQQHTPILASLCTFSCHYFHLTNSLGSNLEPVKFRFKFCLFVPL